MTVFHIKIIAIFSMLIDHIGLFLFPEVFFLRIIGRLAFPLFAWLIANGALHTSNIKAYLARLFGFALISQIPYVLISRTNDPFFSGLNIFFTLFLGLMAITLIRDEKNTLIRFAIIIVAAVVAELIGADYGAAGVLSIIAFYLTFKDIKKMVFVQTCIFSLFYVLPATMTMMYTSSSSFIPPLGLFQIFAVVSLLFIGFYNNQQGPKLKYLFYFFYPLHLLVLYLIKVLY